MVTTKKQFAEYDWQYTQVETQQIMIEEAAA